MPMPSGIGCNPGNGKPKSALSCRTPLQTETSSAHDPDPALEIASLRELGPHGVVRRLGAASHEPGFPLIAVGRLAEGLEKLLFFEQRRAGTADDRALLPHEAKHLRV